jgi:hypothetical protein
MRHASRELEMSTMTVWRVLQNEALQSSFAAVSSITLVHGVVDTRVGCKVLHVRRESMEPR